MAKASTLTSAYQDILGKYLSLTGGSNEPLAPEYQQMLDLYRPGGARAESELAQIAETYKGLGAQARYAGVSSGIYDPGAQLRANRYMARDLSAKRTEYENMYGNALGTVASAREARYARLAQLGSGLAGIYSPYLAALSSKYSSDISRMNAQDASFAQMASRPGVTWAKQGAYVYPSWGV